MIVDADVARVVDSIVALYRPDQVIAFGSYAKGLLHEGSDLDLIVIKPWKLPRFRRGRDIQAVLATMALSVDLLCYTSEEVRLELDDPYSMLSAILPGAKTLYPRP